MQSLTRSETGKPLGELQTYALRSSATPFNPADSSGELPSFNATIADVKGDARSLVGAYVTLRDWSGYRYFDREQGQVTNGRVTAVRRNADSGLVSLEASSIFERLNTEQTVLPILQSDALDYVQDEALRHWCLMAGVPEYNIEGNLHTYISKWSQIGYLGNSDYKWRYFGPPTSYNDYVTTEGSLGGDAPRLEVNPAQSLTIGMRVDNGVNCTDFQVEAYQPQLLDTVRWTIRRLGNSWYLYERIGSGTTTTLKSWVQAPLDTMPMYFFVKFDANAAADKADITFRLIDFDYVTQQTLIYDSVSTGVTTQMRNRPIPRKMRLGYDNSVSSGRVASAPSAGFITEDATLQEVYPANQLFFNTFVGTPPHSAAELAKMPTHVPGFTGNVWDKMREFCAIFDLDIFYRDGVISFTAREALRKQIGGGFIPAQTLAKGRVVENIQDRDSARMVEVNVYERLPKADNFNVMFKADSVYSLAKGETKIEKVQTNNTFVFLNQPIPVSGVPVPYTSAFGSYVVTGADGFIVDPQWWKDNGGSITVKTTKVSGEIEITMQAPTVDTTRAPYRISEGISDRPALYIVGYGLAQKEPETMRIYTGNSKAAQEVGTTFESPFVTTKLIGMNVGHRLAEVYGTGQAVISFDSSRADAIELMDSSRPPTPVGDSVYWKGSYYRLVTQHLTPRIMQFSDCHTHNTIGVINGEFAEAKTIADWNALHPNDTIADVNLSPLPQWES
ncbi:minor tail protein [Arthrobacter phage Anansi]|uniref:Minor tail protein n=3 Tax=Amigovirus amigo TaxID=1982100 RepID=A0A0U4IP20_9CAUD|nr:minor tail protein [Arthrobacter phage Anansi]ALY09097.1 minor tail protein [Arthrobacter phage Gorgeous]ALY10378.1 minor tail protein [Arthrobacter phage SorJuana]